jgi:hypothetical protein
MLQEIVMKTRIRFAIGATALTAILSAATPSLAQPPQPSLWCYYHSCPEDGFGSRTPVTLPADHKPHAGKDSGIPIANKARPEIPQLGYFRPK